MLSYSITVKSSCGHADAIVVLMDECDGGELLFGYLQDKQHFWPFRNPTNVSLISYSIVAKIHALPLTWKGRVGHLRTGQGLKKRSYYTCLLKNTQAYTSFAVSFIHCKQHSEKLWFLTTKCLRNSQQCNCDSIIPVSPISHFFLSLNILSYTFIGFFHFHDTPIVMQ